MSVRAENPCYRGFPVAALGELLAFMDVVDVALPQVRAPLLVMHATQDHTAPVASARRIVARAGSSERPALTILPESYHLISCDVERDQVAAEVGAWCARHLAAT